MNTDDVRDTIRRPVRAGVATALLVAAASIPGYGFISARSVYGVVFWGLCLALILWAAARMARSGVTVTSAGLIVRDTLRTRRIPWSQVQYISPATDGRAFRAVGIVTGQGRVRCNTLGAMRFEGSSHRRVRQPYVRLNRHFETARRAGLCAAAEEV